MAGGENTAARVLETARGEIGVSDGGKYIDFYNEITGAGLPREAAWCAAWVTWVMRKAGVPEESVLNYKGCATASAWFQARGRFYTRDSGYVPKPGDIIMYEWDPENEGTPYDDGDDHTGIVERVEDGRVYTIEGNNDGMCRRDWWSLTAPCVSGYCVPLYNLGEAKLQAAGGKRCNTVAELPAYARAAVVRLIEAGKLRGKGGEKDENGYPAQLDLSEDMIRLLVIMDEGDAAKF